MARSKKNITFKRVVTLFLIIILGYSAYKVYTRYFTSSRKEIKLKNIPELPEGFYSYGIDVSHHQESIDWDVLFKETDSIIKFVYCKVSEGSKLADREWKRNHDRLYNEGIPHGGYHFFHPNVDPLIQAYNFIQHYQHFETILPPALDVEIDGNSDEELIENMYIWLRKIEEITGKRPIIYTSYNFYSLKFKGKFDRYKFWVANYSNRKDRFVDDEIIHWQFSEKGKIPGINGYVDLNYSKVKF